MLQFLTSRLLCINDAQVNKSFEENVVLRIDGGQQFKCVIRGRITPTDGLGSMGSTSTYASSCLSQSSLLENDDHISTDVECAQGLVMGSHRVRPSVTTRDNQGDEPSILNKLVSAIGKWSTQESPRRRVSSVNHLNAISAATSSGFM